VLCASVFVVIPCMSSICYDPRPIFSLLFSDVSWYMYDTYHTIALSYVELSSLSTALSHYTLANDEITIIFF
jgi:hypothetical protein